MITLNITTNRQDREPPNQLSFPLPPRTVREAGDKIDASKKKEIEDAKEELSKAIESGNNDDIKAKTDALTEKLHAFTTEMYKQAQKAAASNAGAKDGDAPKDDKVVDADFEVVDEDKK